MQFFTQTVKGVKCKFDIYPINQNLEPDYDACRALSKVHPDIFVLVHYFGKPTFAAPTKDFCTKHNAWLLEDAAHVLRPITGVGKYGDFIIYSPHKLLPLPDGAVLIIRSDGPGELDTEKLQNFDPNSAWTKDLSSQEILERVPVQNSIKYNAEWLFKRIIQKSGLGPKHKVSEFIETGKEDVKALALIKPELSYLSRILLETLRNTLADVVRTRKRHQLLWDYVLVEESNLKLLYLASRPKQREWTPYMAAFATKNENIGLRIFESLESHGLPVTTWPDLAPEVCANRDLH